MEEHQVNKARQIIMLRNCADEKIREAGFEIRNRRKWSAASAVKEAESRLHHKEIVGGSSSRVPEHWLCDTGTGKAHGREENSFRDKSDKWQRRGGKHEQSESGSKASGQAGKKSGKEGSCSSSVASTTIHQAQQTCVENRPPRRTS